MMANREGINRLNDDIIHNILARLPALSFAFATCVNKTWYHVSTQILSRPKLVSALSLNPYLIDAVDEVLDKVLCMPIRPDFAIACISDDCGLKLAHHILTVKLGARTPLVTHISNGVMGMDALTDELKEVQWEYFDYRIHHPRENNAQDNANKGMLLVIGCLPGLKVDTIPLFHPKRMGLRTTMADITTNFINEIKTYTATVSGEEFPSAIMTFGDLNCDVNFLIAKMDHVMPKETAIVGDGGGCFMFNSLNYTITIPSHTYVLADVALVFAKDKNKYHDVGETKFHVVMAGGLLPFGSPLKVHVIAMKIGTKSSWISAKTMGGRILTREDFEAIKEVYDDLSTNLYIGVTQKKKYNSGRSSNLETSVVFYHVIGDEDHYFIVDGTGIMLGDSFQFYYRDLETASSNNDTAYMYMKTLKENTCRKTNDGGVFGGLIFSCHSRGESYFGHPNYDSFPFSLNFPDVPVAGMFCKGEIGRGSSCFVKEDEDQKQCLDHCCRHACSAIYLVMSYHHPLYEPSIESLQIGPSCNKRLSS